MSDYKKNNFGCETIIVGNNEYNINEEYYISGYYGKNPGEYPSLSSFIDAEISTKTGISLKYPKYHFKFELFQSNDFDYGLTNIYKLIITKITK